MEAQRRKDRERQTETLPLHDLRKNRWTALFRHYDQDGDGRISIQELRAMVNTPGFDRGELPQEFIQNLMQMSDSDNDGYLNEIEFVEMIHRPENKNLFRHFLIQYIELVVPGSRQTDVARHVYKDGPQKKDSICWPPPVCMIIVSIVELVLYMYDAYADHTLGTGPIAKKLIYNPYKRNEAWRFFSYMFVHIGLAHLQVNITVQLALGIPLEIVNKSWSVVLVYVAGVFAGSLFTSITNPSVYLAGASGGVYALLTAHIATIALNWRDVRFPIFQLLIYLIIICIDVGSAVYNRYTNGEADNIGYSAHFGGAIAGILVGICALRNIEVQPWEKKVWWCTVIIYFALMSTFILMNIFWTQHFRN